MSTSTRRSIAHRYPTIASNFVDLTTENDVVTTQMAETSNGNKSIDGDLYKQLQELDEMDGVIRNKKFIYCVMCEHFIDVYDGILIRECLHQVCIDCIRKGIIACVNVDVKCPAVDCVYFLQDREIRSLLTQTEYEFHSNKYEMAHCNEQLASYNGQMNKNEEKLYKELLNLEQQGIIYNPEPFECEICITDIVSHEGIIIRECLHQFCIDCVRHTIVHSEEVEIKCPANACDCFIQDREIRSLLTQAEFDHYSMKVLRIAESKATNSYHCKMANCEGWCIVEEEVNTFTCPRCFSKNCLACQAIHVNRNCKEYQDELRFAGMNDDQRTEMHLDEILKENKGMRCTTCKIVIMKREGCDWLVCSMCKTELCWATKMNRWGPKGRGDTSSGCGCLPTKRCHPKCRNCH